MNAVCRSAVHPSRRARTGTGVKAGTRDGTAAGRTRPDMNEIEHNMNGKSNENRPLAPFGVLDGPPPFTRGASLAVRPGEQNAVAGMVTVNGIADLAAPALGVLPYGIWMPLPFLATSVGCSAAWVRLRGGWQADLVIAFYNESC
jgi:hypothetical protein